MIVMVQLEVTIHGLSAATTKEVVEEVSQLIYTRYHPDDVSVDLTLSASWDDPEEPS